tara:strand:- start:103 stop:606 length:504 start_codon:yes stop_codon:yes gene_type:complete
MSFVNNVKVGLKTGITSSQTTADVYKAVAPLNNPPESGKLTIIDNLSAPTKIEVITYTGRTDNSTYWTLTGIVRGLEDSTAYAFDADAIVIQTWTALSANKATPLTNPVFTYTNDVLTLVTYNLTDTKTFTYNLDGSLNTSTLTLNGNVTVKTCNYTNSVLTSITDS